MKRISGPNEIVRHGAYDQTTFSDEDIDAYTKPFAGSRGVRGANALHQAVLMPSAR